MSFSCVRLLSEFKGWGGRGSDNVGLSLPTTDILRLQALDYPHGTAHRINPVFTVQKPGFFCHFFLFDLCLPHGPFLLSMFRNLFMFFHKREAHRIYPDPTNLIWLVSRFFHCSLSGQCFLMHLITLLLIIGSASNDKRCDAAAVFVCRLSRSSCPWCPSAGWTQFFPVLMSSSFRTSLSQYLSFFRC